ncbi:putative iron export permease protein FetB [Clostridium pasteurianum DSM 525 = ATCC 6013]|uniref:Putative iron export permease protein FetB n=1 Tax=Clostridium pasteurianum DSM 525 = ATCC 6013 TaxID=1262449 RepID=A0A0H3JA62_CLOPA|nr:iron export ABC transporter permease subunit FetB [Clostridium pasteurianum]AJA49273.1 putative iron export permease protein FetB [Clostridium pasteurianum DSM 525 = ATCC 6013]AJA53261.1 putative iron export permease protein FetB [Clostridium pasteurianum DSM 525 = ATCC 6013]AOZ76451.1 hypothetical protein AQ983_15565 [Clostridium pasteurianum DSM 525 = ATCC 6013]AOZ80248.1 hypothetical protein AQ984_15560 [Clostridium pasteurianum]ELP58293.1 membrane protein [Clostridium pasteurianum DSM 5
MNGGADISISSMLVSSLLVMVSLFFTYFQKLNLEKEIIIGVIRAVVQLVVVGYLLNYIFGLKSPIFTTFLLSFMIFNASYNAAKRNKGAKNGLLISFISIALGASITISILVFSGIIKYEAYQIIPIGGMIISNSMVALGLCFKQMNSAFKDKREEVQTKLSLGADILPSSIDIIRDSIKTGMMPTIDSTKTLGIVSLPGMMTGLILAGTSPVSAIKYQIIVTFMLLSTTAICSFIACYMCYRNFFNKRKQLI